VARSAVVLSRGKEALIEEDLLKTAPSNGADQMIGAVPGRQMTEKAT